MSSAPSATSVGHNVNGGIFFEERMATGWHGRGMSIAEFWGSELTVSSELRRRPGEMVPIGLPHPFHFLRSQSPPGHNSLSLFSARQWCAPRSASPQNRSANSQREDRLLLSERTAGQRRNIKARSRLLRARQ